MTRRTRLGLAALVLAGCGGGTSDPNPPPPPPPPPAGTVATVTVTPGTPSPFTGETVQLTATPTTATGAVVTGKTVTWSSGATAVATVSGTGLVTALTAGSATITATVDGKSGSAQVMVQDRAALDAAHRVTKAFNTREDSVTTVSSGGVTYTLLIPAGALSSTVSISMTPLGSLQGTLPASGSLLAGVKLEPAGTQFVRPVTLRITNSQPTPAGKVRVGFTAPDAGGSAGLLLSRPGSGGVEVLVSHFSLVGLGAVLPADIASMAPANSTGLDADLATTLSIIGSGASQSSVIQQLTVHFENWYTRIAPILVAGTQGDAELLTALSEYAHWKWAMEAAGILLGVPSFIQVPSLTIKANDGDLTVGSGLSNGIDRANTTCAAQRTFVKAGLALFWQTQAEELLPASVNTALLLDRAAVLSHLCVQIINTELLFPDPVTPGQTANLQVRFGVKFGTDPNLLSVIFNLRIDIHGTTADGPVIVPTAADGRFSQQVVPTGQTTFQADVKACLDALFVGADDVCATATVTRPFGRTIVGNVTVQTATGLLGISDVSKIQGNLVVFDAGTDPITTLSSLNSLQEVTGSVTLSTLPQVTSLSGLKNLRTVGADFVIVGLANLTSVDGLDNLRTIPGTLTLGALPLVANLQGLAQLLTIGNLTTTNLPLVSSFAGLNQARITGGISVQGMPVLTSIAGPTFDPALPGDIRIQTNPLLANLGGLRNVTSIDGSLTVVNNPAVQIADLAALTVVQGNVQIASPTITSVAMLGLQRIGGELFITPAALPQMASFTLPALIELRRSLPPAPGIPVARIRIDLTGCNTAPRAPMTLSFPALTVMANNWTFIDPNFRPLGCIVDINVPSLVSSPGLFELAAVRTLNLGPVVSQSFGFAARFDLIDPAHPMTSLSLSGISAGQGVIGVGSLPNLQTLTITGLSAGDLHLIDLPKLTSITVSGHVSDEVVFFASLLSDAQMIAVGTALGARAVWKQSASGTVRLFPP